MKWRNPMLALLAVSIFCSIVFFYFDSIELQELVCDSKEIIHQEIDRKIDRETTNQVIIEKPESPLVLSELGCSQSDEFLEKMQEIVEEKMEDAQSVFSAEEFNRFTKLLNNFTALWKQLQWGYRGFDDTTEEYLLYKPHYGASPEEKEQINKDYQKLASKYPCESNLWCDTWYPEEETKTVQEYIWKYQHPADCQNTRILLWIQPQTGIGAMMHHTGVGLTHAMSLNRTLVLVDSTYYVDEEHCGSAGAFGCYFLPISNCTHENAVLPIPGVERDPELYTEYDWMNPENHDKRVVVAYGWQEQFYCAYSTVPKQWVHKGLYWWRSQTTNYVARPRIALQRYVERQKKFIFHKYGGKVPHPIMSMHVRHGDKWVENDIYPLHQYMALARVIKAMYNISRIFLSTEDQGVITEAVERYSNEFEIFYHDIPRLNIDPFTSQKIIGASAESLISYTSYLVALECDAFVGQRESSFCRFIDEGRKAIGKARIPYSSVGPKGYEPITWFKFPDDVEPEELKKWMTVCQPPVPKQQPITYDANLVTWTNDVLLPPIPDEDQQEQ